MLVSLYNISRRGVAGTPSCTSPELAYFSQYCTAVQVQAVAGGNIQSPRWKTMHTQPISSRNHLRYSPRILQCVLQSHQEHRGFWRTLVSIVPDRKTEVVSFTSLRPVKELFSVLSGISEKDIVQYFKRSLTGRKTGSKVSVLTNQEKNMAFVYKFHKGQLAISFYFGEWNSYGFPQHN